MSVKKIQDRFKDIKTIQQAINVKSQSLSEINKEIGKEKTILYIGLWLTEFTDIVPVKYPLNIAQINYINAEIFENYRNLRLADINLIFKNAKAGEYGKFYERITPVDVLTWFREYNELRMEICAGNSYNKSQNLKESGAEPRNSELTVKEFLKNIKK